MRMVTSWMVRVLRHSVSCSSPPVRRHSSLIEWMLRRRGGSRWSRGRARTATWWSSGGRQYSTIRGWGSDNRGYTIGAVGVVLKMLMIKVMMTLTVRKSCPWVMWSSSRVMLVRPWVMWVRPNIQVLFPAASRLINEKQRDLNVNDWSKKFYKFTIYIIHFIQIYCILDYTW